MLVIGEKPDASCVVMLSLQSALEEGSVTTGQFVTN